MEPSQTERDILLISIYFQYTCQLSHSELALESDAIDWMYALAYTSEI